MIRGRRVLAVFVTAMTAASGVAYAYFTATGSGAVATSSSSMQSVTLSALAGGDTPSARLYPGGPGADVILRVNNANAFTVQVVGIAGNGAITADAAHSGCTTTGVTFTSPVSPSITVPTGSSLVHLAGAAGMSTASLSACQGATFNIPVAITVHR